MGSRGARAACLSSTQRMARPPVSSRSGFSIGSRIPVRSSSAAIATSAARESDRSQALSLWAMPAGNRIGVSVPRRNAPLRSVRRFGFGRSAGRRLSACAGLIVREAPIGSGVYDARRFPRVPRASEIPRSVSSRRPRPQRGSRRQAPARGSPCSGARRPRAGAVRAKKERPDWLLAQNVRREG